MQKFALICCPMGYSKKNPHLPDEWQTGNPGGRGDREGLVIQVGGGCKLESSSGVNFLGFAK